MNWESEITNLENGITRIKGKKLIDLADNGSFAKNFYFVQTGKEASDRIVRAIDLALSLSLDHGLTPSTISARISASTDADITQSIVSALGSMGKKHGQATALTVRWLQKFSPDSYMDEIASEIEKGEKVPGLGHSILKNDERADFLINYLKTNQIWSIGGEMLEFAQKKLSEKKSKDFPINIDGAIGAMSFDIGLSANAAFALFFCGRMAGLIAHIDEEIKQGGKIRRVKE